MNLTLILHIRKSIDRQTNMIRRQLISYIYRYVRDILDTDAILTTENQGRAAILTIEGFIRIKQKYIFKFQTFALMNCHQADCMLRSRNDDTRQIVLCLQYFVNHPNKTR